MQEQWRPVSGYSGTYEVSNFGNVRSWTAVKKGGLMTQRVNVANGYRYVHLHSGGPRRNVQVHSLVLTAFVGARPDGLVSRHLDGNPANNRVDNLAWGTESENALDSVRHGTNVNASKDRCKNGHLLSGDNLYERPSGGRTCRQCVRDTQNRANRQKRVGPRT